MEIAQRVELVSPGVAVTIRTADGVLVHESVQEVDAGGRYTIPTDRLACGEYTIETRFVGAPSANVGKPMRLTIPPG